MKEVHNEYRWYEEFCKTCKPLRKVKAVRYIEELWLLKGKAIHPTQLYNLHNSPDSSRQSHCATGLDIPDADYGVYAIPELPIPMCDEKTLYSIRDAVAKASRYLRQAREDCDPPRIEFYEDQLAKLNDYLATCVNKHGHISYITNLSHEHTKLIKRSVRRLYRILSIIDPSLRQYLEQHVVIGSKCYWE